VEEHRDQGSLIGPGSEFQGKLTFFGTVRIEGRFEGEILSEDTLVVAPGAEVRGTIDVGVLVVTGGLVQARVEARQAVELHPAARLVGEVHTPALHIEKGARFEGTCHMPDGAPPPA